MTIPREQPRLNAMELFIEYIEQVPSNSICEVCKTEPFKESSLSLLDLTFNFQGYQCPKKEMRERE